MTQRSAGHWSLGQGHSPGELAGRGSHVGTGALAIPLNHVAEMPIVKGESRGSDGLFEKLTWQCWASCAELHTRKSVNNNEKQS